MKIITDLNFQLNNTAVCIGKFDGIHRGHRLLLEKAEQSGLSTVMFTFLFPDIRSIYSKFEKRMLAEKLGVDIFIEIPVNKEFFELQAESFMEDILVKRCGAKNIIVGEDFCFGHQRRGNVRMLEESASRYDFQVFVFEKLKAEGEIISSTRIREKISEGKMSEVNELLGTPYFIYGKVQQGNQIGRTISVPTANIVPEPHKVLPPFGVYAILAETDNKQYRGVGNLGIKPTIPGENPVGLEVWLFDYEGDLYGKEITISLMAFQRPEKKFDSVESLKQQIMKDTACAKEILSGPDR
ncbi:MAG: bifunctional riboflavin kinase/FAD synthetase [Lachnospiraceae bacterium]|nr:bifunctional riboflavin kinase/FAD synthetase [Lachnospiraceae bacterium]